MQSVSRPYHHGNLRPVLLEIAGDLLEQHGPAALSLRETAALAGVSKTAPYRHFATREVLLDALAEQGYQEMRAAALSAAANDGPLIDRLVAVALAYLDFGCRRPARLQLMFTGDTADPLVHAAASKAFDVIGDLVAEGHRQGLLRDGDAGDQARTVWALMHGVTTLVINGRILGQQLPGRSTTFLSSAILTLLDGLRADPGTRPIR